MRLPAPSLAGLALCLPEERRRGLRERMERFMDKQISITGITMLMDDLIYIGAFDVPLLPQEFNVACAHFINQGLVTVNGRMLQ